MSLTAGTRLGPYEVTGAIGAGGMGEVYRARDTKLGRSVALKILPEALAHDAERLARFRREAQVLAALNHPNIAQIYGFEDSDGMHALVMELVEGPTLAEVIGSGLETRGSGQGSASSLKPQAPSLSDSLHIARQIAEALEAAHEQGIIHRDLKPANVKVRDDGAVKVLDFGLAKALDPIGPTASTSASMSPTITSPAMTAMGMILGTAAYMSPEQAKGRPVDRRSDVWAFGCVLYEMLTGHRAFPGDDVSDTLAAILKTEPRWEALPAGTPAAIHRLLRRCLAKERRERLGDMTAVRLELVDASTAGPADEPPAPRDRPRARVGVVALTAMAVAGAAVASTTMWLLRPSSPPAATVHLTLDMPSGLEWRGNAGFGVAISPDGRLVAYVASSSNAGNSGAQPGVHIRPLDRDETVRIPGSDRAYMPFFSPDGREIGYLNEGKIWRAPVTGGTPLQIGPVDAAARGAAWGTDGFVYLGGEAGLTRTPLAGGPSESLTTTDRAKGEVAHRFPEPLPGGRAVVFHSLRAGLEESRLEVVDLATRHVRTLFDQSGYSGRYDGAGHLLFMRAGVLMAAPFDVGRAELTGPAVPVLDDVAFNTGGAAHMAVSPTGTLVFVPGRENVTTTPVWVERSGNASPVGLPIGAYSDIAISPDGRQIALVRRGETAGSDIVVWDVDRRVLLPVTKDALAFNGRPVWMPDSQTIVFSARPKGVGSPAYLFRVDARGSARPERITRQDVVAKMGAAGQHPASVSSDGATVYFTQEATDADGIYIWRAATSDVERLFEGDRAAEPLISPDGKWIAYFDTGSLWVRAVADGAVRPSVVTTGGSARWSADSRELFVRSVSSLAAFAIDPRTGAADVRPRRLFDTAESLIASFDVAPDGRFLMLRADTPPVSVPHVILNWRTLLTP